MQTPQPADNRKALLAQAAIERAKFLKLEMIARMQETSSQPQEIGAKKPKNLFGWHQK